MADDTDRPKTNLIEMLFSLGYEIKKPSREPFDPRKLKFKPVTPSSSSVSRPGHSSVSSSVSNANPNLTPAGAASTSAARPVNRFESQPATKRPSAIANNLPSTARSSSTRANVLPSKATPSNVPSNPSAASRSYIPNEFDEMLDDNFLLDELPITEEECFKKDLLKNTVRASSPIKPSAALINRSSTITSSSVAQPSTSKPSSLTNSSTANARAVESIPQKSNNSKRARPIDQTPAKKARLGHEEVLILSDSELISLVDDEDLEEFLPAKENVNNLNSAPSKKPAAIRSNIDQNNNFSSTDFIINEANRDRVTASLLDCDLDEDIDVESQRNDANRRPAKNLPSSSKQPDQSAVFTGNYRNDGTDAEFRRKNHPFSKNLIEQFGKTFGLKEFRHNQLEAINAIMLKRDCFVLMPTGSGKSICYQLPAVISGGITIVASPLISLIKDQVQKLNQLGVVADTFTVGAAIKSEEELYDDLTSERPAIKLLYLTPEKISKCAKLQDVLKDLYERGLLDRIVIDEAHCISQWGHDFRPDYKKLVELRERFPDLPIMALTATATPRVRVDILKQLKMVNTAWFLQSFNRPNLKFEVKQKGDSTLNEIMGIIKEKFDGSAGIIYCLSRKDCERVARFMSKEKILAKPYHAGLNDELRKKTQEDWLNGHVNLVCATIAFGMGIDKSDVRYVFHYSAPWSIEGYYQECGRAGRDGMSSICYLYFSNEDIKKMHSMVAKDWGTVESKQIKKNNIDDVLSYCTNYDECRRVRVLRYFGEAFDTKNCSMSKHTVCDNCESRSQQSHSGFYPGSSVKFPVRKAIKWNRLPIHEEYELGSNVRQLAYDALEAVSREISREKNMHYHNILPLETLREISVKLPTTAAELLRIANVTRDIYDKFGQRYLKVTKEYKNMLEEHRRMQNEQTDRPSTSSGARGGRAGGYRGRFKRRFKKKTNFKYANKRDW